MSQLTPFITMHLCGLADLLFISQYSVNIFTYQYIKICLALDGEEGNNRSFDKGPEESSVNTTTNPDFENQEPPEDLGDMTNAKEEQSGSPAPEQEDSSSEKEQDDRDLANENVNGYMEHDDGNERMVNEDNEAESKKAKSSAASDHPLSLVVNASA